MKPYKVNADYEVELFHQRLAPPAINQTIEFFLFFLCERPLYSEKKYTDAYLAHVERLTQKKPLINSQGAYENFWGPLKDIEAERWWNSKLTSTRLIIDQGWCCETQILTSEEDLQKINWNRTYLLKDPSSMSGQKFLLLREQDSVELKRQTILKALSLGPQILEPKFDRNYDFSQYVYPSGEVIVYKNVVDEKFQYKGTVFPDFIKASLDQLPFYHEVDPEEWKSFQEKSQIIQKFYSQKENRIGYSIDSFVYQEQGKLKIRVMSEVNYRWTMGRVAYELSKKYALKKKWTALILAKIPTHPKPLWELFKTVPEVMVLSPGDSRFEIFFLQADDQAQGSDLVKKMNELLAYTEPAIKF